MIVKQEISFSHSKIRPMFEVTTSGAYLTTDAIALSVFEQHNSGLSLSGKKFPNYSHVTVLLKSKFLGKNASKPNLNWSGNLHYLSGRRYKFSLKNLKTYSMVSLDFGTSYSQSKNFRRFEDWSGPLSNGFSNIFTGIFGKYDFSKLINIKWRLK